MAVMLLPALALLFLQAPAEVRLSGETARGATREVPPSELPVDDLAALDLVVLHVSGGEEAPLAAEDDLARLVLAGGERLAGRVAGGEGESLSLRLLGDVVLPVGIGRLRSLVFPARIPEGSTEPVQAPAELDRLYRRVGGALDTLDGTVQGFTPEGVRFGSTRLGERLVPWGEVAALFVEVLAEETDEAAAPGAPVVVDLADGSRLRGRMSRLSAAGLELSVGGEVMVTLPLSALGEIARDDGSVAFLSDLPLEGEEGRGNPFDTADEPYGMVWPCRPDRAVTGTALRAGGRVFRRGLGAHAPSRLRFPLDGSYRELHGAVAIDDSTLLLSARGSVVFRILLDGQAVFESGSLSAGDPPVTFPPVQLEGKRELVLEADMAADLNQGDRADWLRMMLVR
jgi:hypothetical protein